MAAHPPTAPQKLFRDEAKTGAVQCPACGGPITLKGFGAVERVACPYCGSELSPEDSGALQLLQQAQRQRRQSALPLHARGTFDGDPWEVLGIIWRDCKVDGVVYPWQEFLLYNPYKGYRWLVFQMSDGHWSLGEALAGAPKISAGIGHKKIEFKDKTYKHFQTVRANASYVEGEFPWQVRVGDAAMTHEYIAPPHSIAIEEAQSSEGADVNFTGSRHITGAEVWKAFKAPGSPPRSAGVGNLVPNPWRNGRILTIVAFFVLIVLWGLASFAYAGARDSKVVFSKKGVPAEPISQEIEIGTKGETTTLEFYFTARPLDNGWAFAEVMLINQESEEAIGFGATAEYWHGVSGGESWSEGSREQTIVIGDVPGGKYTMQIVPSAGKQSNQPAPTNLVLDMRLRQDIVLLRYIAIPLVVIIVFPLIFFFLSAAFEGRRWQNSDYSSAG